MRGDEVISPTFTVPGERQVASWCPIREPSAPGFRPDLRHHQNGRFGIGLPLTSRRAGACAAETTRSRGLAEASHAALGAQPCLSISRTAFGTTFPTRPVSLARTALLHKGFDSRDVMRTVAWSLGTCDVWAQAVVSRATVAQCRTPPGIHRRRGWMRRDDSERVARAERFVARPEEGDTGP